MKKSFQSAVISWTPVTTRVAIRGGAKRKQLPSTGIAIINITVALSLDNVSPGVDMKESILYAEFLAFYLMESS